MSRLLLGITTVILLAVLGFAYLGTQEPAATPAAVINTQASTDTPTGVQTTPPSSRYTLATVATHRNADSCWAAINGNVYDLTKWINQHPGGPGTILSICGTEASNAFNAQHGGQTRPSNELANYFLGPLTN